MASIRGEIHINELGRFSDWLIWQGYTIEPCKGEYEVLRARKDKELLVFYKRMRSNHLSSSLEKNHIKITDDYRRFMRNSK